MNRVWVATLLLAIIALVVSFSHMAPAQIGGGNQRQQWEYQVGIGHITDYNKVGEMLNARGDDGWELFFIDRHKSSDSGGIGQLEYYFKRPKR